MGKTEDKASKESFFSGLSAEFKKIIWPEKKSLARQTTAVIAVSVVMGLVIALLDFIIQYGVDFLVGLGLFGWYLFCVVVAFFGLDVCHGPGKLIYGF